MSKELFDSNIIQRSCRITREIHDLLVALQEALKTSRKEILVDGGKQIHLLQKEVITVDLELDERLNGGSHLSDAESDALEDRIRLRKEILKLNKTLIPKITNIKSTLAGEMVSLKQGRTALKGYGDNSINRGKVINKSW